MNFFQKAKKYISSAFKKVKDSYDNFFVARELRLAKAIIEIDEEKVVKLLKDNKGNGTALGIPFIQVATLVNLALENQNLETALSDQFKTKFKVKHKKDFSVADCKKKTSSIIELLIKKGANVNDSASGALPFVFPAIKILGAVDLASMSRDSSLISLFISKGANLEKKNQFGLKPIEIIAFHDDAKSLLQQTGKFKSDDEIENSIKAMRANVILNLSYSTDDYGLAMPIINKIISKASEGVDFAKKEMISEVLTKSDYYKPNKDKVIELKDFYEKKVKIHTISYKDHAAFALIEFGKNDKPFKITYCDGNNGFKIKKGQGISEYTYGALTFYVDQTKIESLRKSLTKENSQKKSDLDLLEDYLRKSFKTSANNVYKNNGRKFDKILSKVTKCEFGKPIIQETSIPTKSQKRGNCALKANNIMVREILRRTDPEMIFEIDGRPDGEGYKTYKAYKEKLTKKPIDDLIELASLKHKGTDCYDRALDALKGLYLKAARKVGQLDIFKKIDQIFDREGIDYKEIIKERYKKNDKGIEAQHDVELAKQLIAYSEEENLEKIKSKEPRTSVATSTSEKILSSQNEVLVK